MKNPFTLSGSTDSSSHPVSSATDSLKDLIKRGVQVPAEIAGPILETEQAGGLGKVDDEGERRFWLAWQALNSKIKPHEATKRYYRRLFWIVLVSLLTVQLYHSAATTVLAKLPVPLPTTADRKTQAGAKPDEAAVTKVDLDRATAEKTLTHVAEYLVPFPRFSDPRSSDAKTTSNIASNDNRNDVLTWTQLDLLTSFTGRFLLPLCYGMLGAVAFVLRRLSDDTDNYRATRDPRNRYSLRVPIGALSGLAAGWVLQPGVGQAETALTPLALAFVAGYSAELVFAAMDRIVVAFSGSPGREAELTTTNLNADTATGLNRPHRGAIDQTSDDTSRSDSQIPPNQPRNEMSSSLPPELVLGLSSRARANQ